MIDCHTHAYPQASEQFSRAVEGLAPALHTSFKQSVAPLLDLAQGALARAVGNLARSSERGPMGIEKLAQQRQQRSSGMNKTLETGLSAVAAPPVLLLGTLEQLLASMEQHGIERSVLIAGEPAASNTWVLEAARASAETLIPVTMLPQMQRDADEGAWIDGFEALVADGAQGLKIHANMDGHAPDHPVYRTLFEVAQARKRFVIIHTGAFAAVGYKHMRPADPASYEPLFEAFPEVPVCLAHMNRDEPQVVFELMQRHEQLYTDTSWQPAEAITQAVEAVGSERLLFGSDWPLLHLNLQGDGLDVLRRAVSEQDAERIGGENARRFLGL
jgi:uncharacterized protein